MQTDRVDVGATPGADPTQGAAMHATREPHLGAWGQPRTSQRAVLKDFGARKSRLCVPLGPIPRGVRRCTRRESRIRVLGGRPRTSRDEGGALSRRRHIEEDASTITAYLYS